MSTGQYQNKEAYWYEKDYVLSTHSCLYFIKFALLDFLKNFSQLYFIIHVIGTAIVKNKCVSF